MNIISCILHINKAYKINSIMADELQASLQNYILQLEQVDAALSIDPDNGELQTLKKDLDEVLTLTKDLIKQQLADAAGASVSDVDVPDEDLLKPRPQHNFHVGDSCMAMSSDDGKYYESVIEDITDDGEQVSVKFVASGTIEVTVFAFLKPIKHQLKRRIEEAKARKQTESQREYQKKRKLKKQDRYKQQEEEREHEKNKWLAFSTKKKGGPLTKKSIFASPESVAGRVGIGTCGVSGLPMTEYSLAEKRKKKT